MNKRNETTGVAGTIAKETTYFLKPGQGFLADTTQEIQSEQVAIGGSGASNAIAMRSTGERVTLMSYGATADGEAMDTDSVNMRQQLSEMGVATLFQRIPGVTAEYVHMFISGRTGEGKQGFKRAGLRDKFKATDKVVETMRQSDLAVVSGLNVDVIADLSRSYNANSENGILAWTLNHSSATMLHQAIYSDNSGIMDAIREGNVSMILASRNETQTAGLTDPDLRVSPEGFGNIPLVIETRGKEGVMLSYRNGRSYNIEIPTRPLDVVMNDNGAGEAMHNNMLKVIVESQRRGIIGKLGEDDSDDMFRVLTTAARVGMFAARVKIGQTDSVWFPTLNHDYIMHLVTQGVTPESIELMLEQRQQNVEENV